MGVAEAWQEKIVGLFPNITLLNPSRDDWDSSWEQSKDNPQFREQVEWELQAMEDANLVVFHFDPMTKSPITLLELGIFKHKALVHCPEGFWRKGNLDIVCQRYNIPQVASYDGLSKVIRYLTKCG